MLFISKGVTLLFSLLVFIGCSHADKLQTVYQWQEIDFKYNNADERQLAINSHAFIPENVIPVAMEVVDDRLFLTLPRLKPGVPASLAYIDLKGKCWIFYFFYGRRTHIRCDKNKETSQ